MSFLPLAAPPGRCALQLVVTLGPASTGSIAALAEAGATAFRLNASHLDPPEMAAALDQIRSACPAAPVVVDLQGAKMRIELDRARDVAEGEILRLNRRPGGDAVVPHREFFEQVRAGDTISVDDGRLRLVAEAAGRDTARVRTLNAGRLLPRKGINVEQHPVRLAGLSRRDLEACRVAARHGVKAFAYSFMEDGREAEWVRTAAPGCVVIGKIERLEAARLAREVGQRVDAVWVCRGDLGAQLGLAALARFVGRIDAAAFPVPVLMAGQVLEHLTSHPEPTRSEVCHLHDLAARGFAGVVLSDETAIGRDPVHAVRVAAALLAAFRA